MSSPEREPIVFVPTGKPATIEDYRIVELACDMHNLKGYRRLPPGWTAEAVERVYRLLNAAMARGDEPTTHEILAALFPPPEPEPEPWMREAARDFFERDMDHNSPEALARHIAKHATERYNTQAGE